MTDLTVSVKLDDMLYIVVETQVLFICTLYTVSSEAPDFTIVMCSVVLCVLVQTGDTLQQHTANTLSVFIAS